MLHAARHPILRMRMRTPAWGTRARAAALAPLLQPAATPHRRRQLSGSAGSAFVSSAAGAAGRGLGKVTAVGVAALVLLGSWRARKWCASLTSFSTRILVKTMRDAVRNKGRWKRRHTPTQDPSTPKRLSPASAHCLKTNPPRARWNASAAPASPRYSPPHHRRRAAGLRRARTRAQAAARKTRAPRPSACSSRCTSAR